MAHPGAARPSLPATTPRTPDPLLRDARLGGAAMVAVAALLPMRAGGPILCPLRAVTGVPCPFCGMTHGVVAAVHGHLGAAFAYNPAAPLLVALVATLWMLWALRRAPALPAWALSPRVALPCLAVLELVQLHHFGLV
jgi:hypothetical protein